MSARNGNLLAEEDDEVECDETTVSLGLAWWAYVLMVPGFAACVAGAAVITLETLRLIVEILK